MYFAIYMRFLSVLVRYDGPATLCGEHASSEPAVRKKKWDVFQVNAFGFWVKAIDYGNKHRVQYGEYDEGSPLNISCTGR
jgi:hypothetical protein